MSSLWSWIGVPSYSSRVSRSCPSSYKLTGAVQDDFLQMHFEATPGKGIDIELGYKRNIRLLRYTYENEGSAKNPLHREALWIREPSILLPRPEDGWYKLDLEMFYGIRPHP